MSSLDGGTPSSARRCNISTNVEIKVAVAEIDISLRMYKAEKRCVLLFFPYALKSGWLLDVLGSVSPIIITMIDIESIVVRPIDTFS